MANKHGDWIWYELMTTDATGAAAFYGPILGWSTHKSETDGMDYGMFQAADGDFVAGVLPLTADMSANGARPCWLGYVAVADVDASAGSIVAAGGKVLLPARDIPNVGRIAMVSDPQGALLYIMTPSSQDQTSRAFSGDMPRTGHCVWNELCTSDQKGAHAFYQGHFGWVQDGGMDMGAMGTYDFIRHGDILGAIAPLPPPMPMPAWTFYFRVADITEAAQKVVSGGGKVLLDPMEVPGGDWIIQGLDPQGAHFAFVGRKA